VEKLEPHRLLAGLSNGTVTLENSVAGPQKVKHKLDSTAIPLLAAHPKEMKTYVHMKTCT
jgi:hypothetical protein